MSDDLMHPVYLPFTKAELEQHFAPVTGAPDGRHLKYFEASLQRWAEYSQGLAAGQPSPPSVSRLARQMEKDERFWIVSALMTLFHRPGDKAAQVQAFADLLARAQL